MVLQLIILKLLQKEILQVFDVKNLSFLLGAGCSSYLKEKKEVGISTMKPLAKDFYANLEETDKTFIKNKIGIDIGEDAFKENLEKFLEVLFSFKFLVQQRKDTAIEKQIIELIAKVTKFLLKACIDGISNKDKTVVELYKLFYEKKISLSR